MQLMEFNAANNKECSVFLLVCGQMVWIRQYVLSTLWGFASHLAFSKDVCICLYHHASLSYPTDLSV